MAPVRTVGLADTSLRSLVSVTPAARASIGSLRAVLRILDGAGYRSIDAWGDMTFDHSLRALEESPWERLRALAAHLSSTPLRLHLRGRCLLGFRPYSWSVIEDFVAQATDCGVSAFLVYEPLNDLAALERMAAVVRDAGAGLVLALVHGGRLGEQEESVDIARRLAALDPDAVCLKTAGALTKCKNRTRIVHNYRMGGSRLCLSFAVREGGRAARGPRRCDRRSEVRHSRRRR
jgi:pyruvate carboxylase subunit B